jgi:hypothetical protein
MGIVFGPIRFLLPVYRFCWFLYTFSIHLYMHMFRRIFRSNYWRQESYIWPQASYRYAILWEVFLDPSDSYFLLADLVGFYTHWPYMHIFRHIFLSNCWWQRSDIWSQASYRYPISWEMLVNPLDSSSCSPTLLNFIHIEHTFCICPCLVAFSQQLLMAEMWYLVTSFI